MAARLSVAGVALPPALFIERREAHAPVTRHDDNFCMGNDMKKNSTS